MARTRFDAASRYELDDSGMTATRLDLDTELYRLHVVSDGDTVENLAHRLLGDFRRYWEITDLNPQLQHTHCGRTSSLNLPPGETIRVPS